MRGGPSPIGAAGACETRRKLSAALAAAACCAIALFLTAAPVRGAEQRSSTAAAQPEQAHARAGAEEGNAGRGLVDVVARVVNFAILAGTLFYLLRSPIRNYLSERGTQIRRDLVEAAETKRAATAQIEEIDRKMKALPGELETLRAQGAQEIAAEEARIQAAAAAERDRLLEQARREIDQQVKVAERDLIAYSADLAVGVASERITKTITDDDHKRLVDRYVQQLRQS